MRCSFPIAGSLRQALRRSMPGVLLPVAGRNLSRGKYCRKRHIRVCRCAGGCNAGKDRDASVLSRAAADYLRCSGQRSPVVLFFVTILSWNLGANNGETLVYPPHAAYSLDMWPLKAPIILPRWRGRCWRTCRSIWMWYCMMTYVGIWISGAAAVKFSMCFLIRSPNGERMTRWEPLSVVRRPRGGVPAAVVIVIIKKPGAR